MSIQKVLIAIVLLGSLGALVSLGAKEDNRSTKVVRVFGTSEVKTAPDQAVIELGVERQNGSARVAKQNADAAARAILDALSRNGIDAKDVQTTYLSLRPQFNYLHGQRISYFLAQQTMTVTVGDLSHLDDLIESLIRAGGNEIDSIEYRVSDLRRYRDQARDMAVKAAREKAEALAKALGQGIGRASSIEEVPEPAYSSAGLLSNSYAEMDKSRSPMRPSTAAGEKTVSASVTVAFELN